MSYKPNKIEIGSEVKRRNNEHSSEWINTCTASGYDVSYTFTVSEFVGTSEPICVRLVELPNTAWSANNFELAEETKPVQNNADDIVAVATRFAEVQQQIKDLQKEADMLFKKINALTTKQ